MRNSSDDRCSKTYLTEELSRPNAQTCGSPKNVQNTYHQKFHHSFGKAYHVHGHSHCIGKSKDQTNGSSKFWAQTP